LDCNTLEQKAKQDFSVQIIASTKCRITEILHSTEVVSGFVNLFGVIERSHSYFVKMNTENILFTFF